MQAELTQISTGAMCQGRLPTCRPWRGYQLSLSKRVMFEKVTSSPFRTIWFIPFSNDKTPKPQKVGKFKPLGTCKAQGGYSRYFKRNFG